MRVEEAMSEDVPFVAPDATIDVAARMMAELDTDALPVGDADNLQGIITGRDIIIRVVAKALQPGTLRVSEVMSSTLTTCAPGDRADAVAQTMRQEQIRRMPVVDASGRVVGLVTLEDIARLDQGD